MSTNEQNRRRLGRGVTGLCAAVGLAAAGLVAAAPAGAASAATATGCVTIAPLTSVQLVFDYTDVAPTGQSVGDTATFHDNILDGSGNVIGTRDGSAHIVYADPATGHLMAAYDATFFLPGGKVESAGLIDTVAASNGDTTTITGAGTSGIYLGKTGTVSNTKTSETEDAVSISLCDN